MNEFLSNLLNYYSLSEIDYEILTRPIEEVKLLDPNSIKGMDKIKERIFNAISSKEKIVIYGDYDCDGISATTIMYLTFKKLGYLASYYIPSRYSDGYGLNVENVIKLHNNGYKLIIAVDNGIGQFDAIDKANELGIDVIVVDHHSVPETLPNAFGILHPIVSEISQIIASGGYMSLFLSAALLGYYDHYLVTIAGLSVISDLMELKEYNRDVVRLAIEYINKENYLPLKLLSESEEFTEKTFGLDIAPKINSVGRILEDNKVNLLVKYLTSDNEDEIYKLRDWIVTINDERKNQSNAAVDSIQEDYSSLSGIAVIMDAKEGLAGLIANKLLGQYNVPSIVFGRCGDGLLKGSMRSKDGFDIPKALESLKKYVVSGGGHANAGGISIKEADFDEFNKEFKELCKLHPIVEEKKPSMNISLKDINMENYKAYRSLAPFGMGFNEPLFRIEEIPTRGLTFIKEGKHLSTQLSITTKLLGFFMDEKEIKSHAKIDLFGSFNLSYFRGATTLEFRISDYITK